MAGNNSTVTTLTVGRVARLLHFHSNTVRRWSKKGIIRSYHIARYGAPRFYRADITRLLLQVNGNGGSLKRGQAINRGEVYETDSREYVDIPLPIQS